MKKLIPVAVTLALAFATIEVVQARAADVSHYSQTEVRQMIRDAHSVEQYKTLASYFRARQQAFEQQAQSEKQEWDRRSQIAAASYQKYPRPADSSRNRYEYFTYEAGQMSQQAAHFESLSATAQK
jgi:hypothetical protein